MADAPDPAPGSVSEGDANNALRLGWAMAEVLGRFRPDAPAAGTEVVRSDPWILPLDAADERSATEQQVEATKVLMTVAGRAGADLPIDQLTGQDPRYYPGIDSPVASRALAYLVSRLIFARDPKNDLHATLNAPRLLDDESKDPGEWWEKLERFLWMWDAGIQDSLASGAFGTASAYQLGRGLAEAYWALNKNDDPGSPRSWSFLLGRNRATALSVLCRRLAPSIGTVAATAIAASVEAWQTVAESPASYFDPFSKLGEQLIVWRDLLLTQRDPVSLVDKKALERASARVTPLIKAFKWELLLGVAASVALGLSAYYLPHVGGSVGAVLSAFGITAAAVGSRAKAVIQSVTARVRNSMSQELVTGAVIKIPVKNEVTTRFPGWKAEPRPEVIVAAMKP